MVINAFLVKTRFFEEKEFPVVGMYRLPFKERGS